MTPAEIKQARQSAKERQAKKRTLQKAGFVHVSGWVRREDAPTVRDMIDSAAQGVAETMEATQ